MHTGTGTGTADEVSLRETDATWQDMSFSMDMLTCAQREASFLRMIERQAPMLYEDEVTRNAVRRYEQFWLPLQVTCPFAFISELFRWMSHFSYLQVHFDW